MSVSGVSQSSSIGASVNARETIAENFDTFLSLLTTQLKNQNPLEPLDTNQFTQQLVQFTAVEQQLKTNDFLQAMMLSSQNTGNTQAVSYIGKEVTASGAKTELQDHLASWAFNLAKDADVNVTIRNANGSVVYTEAGQLEGGVGRFDWNGVGSDGTDMPDGAYSITIDARDSEGKIVAVTTEMRGVVKGIDLSGSEPVLLVGSARVNLSSVSSVQLPSSADGL